MVWLGLQNKTSWTKLEGLNSVQEWENKTKICFHHFSPWRCQTRKFQNMPSQLHTSPENTCPFAPWPFPVSFVHFIWENGMSSQWRWSLRSCPWTLGVSDSHSLRCGCFFYIHVSILFQCALGSSTEQIHLFVMCTSSDTRKHVAHVSRYFFNTTSLLSMTTYTKKYPPHGEASKK